MRKKSLKRNARKFLLLLQHVLIVTAAVCILAVLTGSGIMLTGVEENYSYSMDAGENEGLYEDSLLFNHIFGRGVADVAKMVAIRSQMETDGHFDGNKAIDVASFYFRYGNLPDRYVTAKYQLEDLIKWSQYGFEYEEKSFSGEQADEFLNRFSIYTRLNYGSGNLQGGSITPFNTEMEEVTEEYSVSANEMVNGEFHRDDTTAMVLFNRYQTMDGKNIEEYTGTWNDYRELCRYIEKTSNELSANYESYLKYKEFYHPENSNVRYYVIKKIGDREEVYTNLASRTLSDGEIAEQFKGYGKYVYYNPEKMVFDTNTLLEEDTVRHVFRSFEYAYPEATKVWIGVDTSYPAADAYVQGKEGYAGYMPSWQMLGFAAACLGIYLLIFLYLTVMEDRKSVV